MGLQELLSKGKAMTNTNFSREELATVLSGAVEAILWTSYDMGEDGDMGETFLDLNYDISDVDADSLAEMRGEVEEFLNGNRDDIRAAVDHPAYVAGGRAGYDPFDLIGHDYALTRDNHGAGFWDRGLGDLGDRLTEAAQVYGDTAAFLDGDTVKFDI